MLKPVNAILALLLLLAVVSAEDQVKSSVCKVCSTTAIVYKVQPKKTISFSEYATYPNSPGTITYITTGTKTQMKPKMTTTVTVNITIYDNDSPYYFETRTFTTHVAGTTTASVCPPTSTPSDYPTIEYCDCKSTATTTILRPVTIGTIGPVYTYDTTLTGPPTSYGHTATSTIAYAVDTYYPSIYYVDFTKTIYTETCTTTLPAYATPTDLTTFKLSAVNNPYVTRPAYLTAETFCTDPPFCDSYVSAVFASADSDSATTFTLVNNSLYDATDSTNCIFAGDISINSYSGYPVGCGSGSTTPLVSNVAIDCFGNLVSYHGDADTWGLDPEESIVALFPKPDPAHGGYNDSGDSDYANTESPNYVGLQVVLD